MAKGNFTVQVGNRTDGTANEYIKVWWESTPDPENNRSKVRVYAKMYRPWYLSVDYNQSIKLWINGKEFTSSRYGWRGSGWTKAFIDESTWVTHKDDGTKSIKIRLKTQVKAWLRSYVGWVDTGNKTIKLDKLARKSSFSINKTKAMLGDTLKVTLDRSSSSVTHAITLKVGDYTKTILKKANDNGSTTSYPTTLSADDILPYMTGQSATGKVTVTTYNGSTSLGSSSKSFTLSLRSTDKPSIATDGTGLVIMPVPISPNTSTDYYIQGKTKAKITINPTTTSGTAGAIKNYQVTVNGQTQSYTGNTITTDALTSSGQNTISVKVTDGRGMVSDAVEQTFTVLPYFTPLLSSFSAPRCTIGNDSNITLDKNGTSVQVTFTYKFANCAGNNNATITLRAKNSVDSSTYADVKSWSIENSSSTDNTITATITEVFGTYSTDDSYDFELEIVDFFGATTKVYTNIGTEELLIDLSENGVGIGKIVERENALEVGWNAYFEETIYGTVQANTSDIRKKILVEDDMNALLNIWDDLEIVLFKYRNGDGKILPGLVAQDVINIFNAHKLDWRDYGMVYEDLQTGFYSINYEFVNQLSMLRLRKLQKEVRKLQDHVAMLEAQSCPLTANKSEE